MLWPAWDKLAFGSETIQSRLKLQKNIGDAVFYFRRVADIRQDTPHDTENQARVLSDEQGHPFITVGPQQLKQFMIQ